MSNAKVNLDNNYRIIADDDNFILQRKLPMRGKKRADRSKQWQSVGYWKDISQVLRAYSRLFVRRKLPNTFEQLLELEHALSVQIEAIGEQCVSLWGAPE